jgi:hypothetical protein
MAFNPVMCKFSDKHATSACPHLIETLDLISLLMTNILSSLNNLTLLFESLNKLLDFSLVMKTKA